MPMVCSSTETILKEIAAEGITSSGSGFWGRRCANRAESALFAEALDVFRSFVQGDDVPALHQLPYLLDDVGIGQRSDIAGVHTIGDGSEDAPHDLARTSLGHVGHEVDSFRPRNLANHGLNG